MRYSSMAEITIVAMNAFASVWVYVCVSVTTSRKHGRDMADTEKIFRTDLPLLFKMEETQDNY